MELSFVLNAIKRYWWVVVACVVFGMLAGQTFQRTSKSGYESTAVLLIAEPTASISDSFDAGGDRYVLGQLSVLGSESLADRVATTLADGLTAQQLQEMVAITQVPGTDIIEITVTADEPDVAVEVASTFVSEYFSAIRAQIEEAQAPDLEALENQLTNLREQLQKVDDQLKVIFADLLSAGPTQQIPPTEQVAPELASDRQILLSQIERVAIARDQIALNSRLRISSQVVQEASDAVLQTPMSKALLIGAGMFSGVLLGIAVAIVLAGLSRTALDERQIEEILGRPIVGEFPRARALAANRRAAVDALPANVARFVDSVAVQAEANATVGKSFTVAVVGMERSSGTTTLAAALAARYAHSGSRVLLVDADPNDPEITRLFAGRTAGIPALLAGAGRHDGQSLGRVGSRLPEAFAPTSVAGLSVVGLGDKGSEGSLRRQVLPDLIATASNHAHVVVFDAGPLLDTATTVHLAQLVDAVVLAVPMRRVLNRTVSSVGERLQGRAGELLPVLVPAHRRRARDTARRAGGSDHAVVVEAPEAVPAGPR